MMIATNADLLAALKAAKGGETFELAPGQYSGLRLAPPPAPYTATVTITSADPANPAQLVGGAQLSKCADIRLTGLAFALPGNTVQYAPALKISGCTRIEVDHCTFAGNETATGYFGYGIVTTTSSDVNIHHNHFSHLYRAGTPGFCQNLKVNDNDHSFLQGDAWQNVSITMGEYQRNLFRDFRLFGSTHVDCIQIMLRTNSSDIPCADVVIADNLLANDPANGRAQLAFVRSEDLTKWHQRITIRGNISFGSNWYPIQAIQVQQVAINDNLCWFVDGADAVTDAIIRTVGSTGSANDNWMSKSGIEPVIAQSGNIADRAKMTATLDDMAAAMVVWNAKFRAPPAPPIQPFDAKAAIAAIRAELDALETGLGIAA